MRPPPGTPKRWTVLTWNADHLLAVDLVRRDEKIKFILAKARSTQANAVLIQQTGAIFPNSVE